MKYLYGLIVSMVVAYMMDYLLISTKIFIWFINSFMVAKTTTTIHFLGFPLIEIIKNGENSLVNVNSKFAGIIWYVLTATVFLFIYLWIKDWDYKK